jgi:peptidoglycan/LPS O-acetylase OafA/YrhL
MVRLGEASYALYLFHSPVGAVVRVLLVRWGGLRLPPAVVLGVQIAVALAVSLAVFAWVERPARAYLRRRTAPPLTPKVADTA